MSILKEPLLHFVVAGAVLFGIYELAGGASNSEREAAIRVGEGEVRWLQETFANQWRRAATASELRGLVEGLVEEALLAREARALGLDQDDTVVRRRLAQKLTFLIEGTTRIVDPTEDELRRYYATNSERFRTEPLVSFTQIFFSPERRQRPELDAEAALMAIGGRGDAVPEGDSLLLGDTFRDVDRQAVSGMFGPDFADAVFKLRLGSWGGPVKSGYGVHLVAVSHVGPAESLPFEEVRTKVLEEWRHQREVETKEAYLAKLREKYGVVIDAGVAPIPAPRTAWSASR